MKEAFSNLRLRGPNRERLEEVNGIIGEYSEQGYRLTLRQLYYQLVSRNMVRNTPGEYSKLSSLLVQGRMAGIVDWDAIEDRIRVPFIPYWVKGIEDALEDTAEQYRLDRMSDQDVYVEVWVEKDALSGVLRRITSEFHVNLMVNRGYSSCTAMHDAFGRIRDKTEEGKECHILYLGDHDPSGVDMVRDIRDRLEEFGVQPAIERIALTQEQIKKFSPPPNPARIKDPRAKDYIARFGNLSWEVDALNPDVLHGIVRESIEGLIDADRFRDRLRQEEEDKKKLRSLMDYV